jgi:hypothetical protein
VFDVGSCGVGSYVGSVDVGSGGVWSYDVGFCVGWLVWGFPSV